MLEILGQSLGAILAGGATGILGSLISLAGEFKKIKEQHRHEERMQEIAIRSMEIEAKLKLEQTAVEGEIKEELAALETLRASYGHDKATYFKYTGIKWIDGMGGFLFGLVDFVRGMIRPVITIGMALVAVEVHNELIAMMDRMQQPLTQDQAATIYANLNNVILYITTTVILWWFGTRAGASSMRWMKELRG